MDELERNKIIIEFISNHQGCNAQDVVDGLIAKISRVPLFEGLNELTTVGVVKDDKTNRREHRLFVDANNPLISVPADLDKFKNACFLFLEKWKAKYAKRRSPVEEAVLLDTILLIYRHLTAMYNLYFTLIWPKKVSDPGILTNLYSIIFSTLPEILSKLSDVFHLSLKEELVNSLLPSIIDNSFSLLPQQIEWILEEYRKYGFRREGEAMLDAVWKISSEAFSQSHVSWIATHRPAMDSNKWKEITAKDWRKLIKYRNKSKN